MLEFAEELAYTCYLTFARQPTHLAQEITYFNTAPNSVADFYVKPNDAHYLLRPETIESLWYLYYITGNKTYQDWGWNIFQVSDFLFAYTGCGCYHHLAILFIQTSTNFLSQFFFMPFYFRNGANCKGYNFSVLIKYPYFCFWQSQVIYILFRFADWN